MAGFALSLSLKTFSHDRYMYFLTDAAVTDRKVCGKLLLSHSLVKARLEFAKKLLQTLSGLSCVLH